MKGGDEVNMNVDMLKMLYQSNLVNNSESYNISSDLTGGKDSFMKILSDTILGNFSESSDKNVDSSLLDSVLKRDDEENNPNDLLLSLMLLMQQSSDLQNNYLNYADTAKIDDILQSLKSSDNLNIGALSGLMQDTQLISGQSNLDNLILSLQNAQQNDNPSIQTENKAQITEAANAENIGRNFPKEIMDSINSARQAHELIRSRIEQARNVAGRAVSTVNEAQLNIENLDSAYQNLKVSVLSAENLTDIATVAVQTGEISEINNNTSVNLLNSEFALAAASEENSEIKHKELNDNIIDENLLTINTADVQTDSKIVKISDESSLIRQSVIEQIRDQIVMMRADGKQTVTMQLNPKELGKLDIKMVFEKGNLSVEILVSNPRAHNLILSNVSELETILQNSMTSSKGFMNLEAPKEAYEQNSNQNNHGHNPGHSNQERQDESQGEFEQIYNESLDDGKADFFAELSRIREYRFNTLSKV